MWLGSMFKMRTSILNTVTTEQMGYIIFSFFVYTKSTNQDCSDFGNTRFKNTAVIVANTTGDFPKIVVTHSGKVASAALACVTPIPSAMDKPTTVVFLKSIGAVVMSLIPVIAIDANTETVAPPSTQYGIVVSTEENFGINPAIRIIIAEVSNTLFATTFVEPTIPTF